MMNAGMFSLVCRSSMAIDHIHKICNFLGGISLILRG